ncbi:hypothetical protein [Marinagarivorans cellulosilyticus]|uniref:Transglycosylase SLT domain-containing protein n=1 Tax=Marinagarivorans cellulosilyticus TaxID=2721545 RepID=A0AAN2BLG7_9GAMM|nr:hypothetical protein [Marinagarivorans cellulosilyticus]BCD98986.1 hypothetical protein MARGE09_P3187 [Marinagarivorans cellulosilyticus]
MVRTIRIISSFCFSVVLVAFASGCAGYRPTQMDDACDILGGKKSWYKDAVKAANKWGTPVATKLAFIHQESRFKADARPPRKKILWIIPGPRASDAYGYAQVKDATWRWYQDKTGARGADRDDFGDVTQFIGWYNKESQRRLGIGLGDAYRQYLAYHEGHGGYERRSYNKKPWLKKVALKVSSRAKMYQQQIKGCKKELEKNRFWFF